MGEPIRRVTHKAAENESYAQGRKYASDVLLIADAAADTGQYDQDAASGRSPTEPLDMESVVRKLIALLSDQQP